MSCPLYRELAKLVQARLNCAKAGDEKWGQKHVDAINVLVDNHMPSGSGIDCGTKVHWGKSTGEKLVFTFSYHHMSEHGHYGVWTHHEAIVTPSLLWGYNLRITGRDVGGVKEYLADMFHRSLDTVVG